MAAGGKKNQVRSANKEQSDTKALALYSPYGWRGTIGLICPSTNTSIEPEFHRLAPDGIVVHVARAFQDGPQEPALYRQIADNVALASRDLGSARVDVIAFGCTSCTYFVPADEIRETMTRVSGAPAVLTADAVVEALKAVGARRIALATPRTDFVNRRETEWLTEQGFEVVSVQGLQLGETAMERANIGRVPPEVAFRLGRAVDRADADAVFVSCTNLPSLPIIARLEQELGKPVITSNQATFWRCLRIIGSTARIAGYGRLLEEY
ncbi:MAG: aspartate/glutamate racemase family protein [Proteobacteria bacterium]|nr:aspartate/glutamate racemase family protein [Pseudomonadota bacterium]MDA1357943.1 aspartate/glutamate racemase family protein [Pseudomonadota bacterium]